MNAHILMTCDRPSLASSIAAIGDWRSLDRKPIATVQILHSIGRPLEGRVALHKFWNFPFIWSIVMVLSPASACRVKAR